MNASLKLAILTSPVRTQIRLAALTYIREDRLSRIVQGWAQPTRSERTRIAAAVGRPEEQLFPSTSDTATAEVA